MHACGVEPRAFTALAQAFILMDLRSQHYTNATGTRPHHVVSPLFWVVGQCLTLSAVTSLVFFIRVEVFAFALLNLTLGFVVLATAVIVEFHEVVRQPLDLEVLGPRPVEARTYAAARYANLLFYVGLIYVALHLMPTILGASLPDAGPGYAPAYLLASLTGSLVTVAVAIGWLSRSGPSPGWEQAKQLLAWTQILLILVIGYGAQLVWRDGEHALELWLAFPPTWVEYVPSTWLASFVERASSAPATAVPTGLGLLTLGAVAVVVTVRCVAGQQRGMQPQVPVASRRPMAAAALGGLGGRWTRWLTRSAEERVGFWLGSRFLRRDGDLQARCLLAWSSPVAVIVLGLLTGQFANPLHERAPPLVALPILAVYLVALAVPPAVYNLCFTADHEASWLLGTAPLEQAAGVARGACKALVVGVATPLALLLGIACGCAWGDPWAALLHAGLAWLLAWPLALAASPSQLRRAVGGAGRWDCCSWP